MKQKAKVYCITLNNLLLLLICSLGQQSLASSIENGDRAEILSAYKNMSQAYANRDLRVLLNFYLPEFSLCTPTKKTVVDYEGFKYALTFWMGQQDSFQVTYRVQKIVIKRRWAIVILKEFQKHTVAKNESGAVTFISELVQDDWKKSNGTWRIRCATVLKEYSAFNMRHERGASSPARPHSLLGHGGGRRGG